MSAPGSRIGLLYADGRRAEQWQKGLRALGVDATAEPTRGAAVDKGDYEITVPPAHAPRARRYVAEVLAGDARLPAPRLLSRPLLVGAALVIAFVVATAAVAVLSS